MQIRKLTEPSTYPVFAAAVPDTVIDEGRFQVRFARTAEEVVALQRLRFEVFNLELGEGLDTSHTTGRDEDRFDPLCHHLVVEERASRRVVGTYRMQTSEMASRFEGFYSAEEFDLTALPPEVIDDAIEVGRACVAREHRNRHVLFLLWKGLAAYLTWNRKRYLFGCCSLTSQDPAEGKRVMDHLEREGQVHPSHRLPAQAGWRCYGPGFVAPPDPTAERVKLPRLFSLYLRYGAKVCSEPALDRFFKTIDYLVLFDLDDLDPRTRKMYFK